MGEYRALTEKEAVLYAKGVEGLFDQDAKLVSKEIGDGNLNLVFHIVDENTGKSIIFKQALPHLRVVGDSWPLTIDRSRIETEAMRLQGEICEGMVPTVYYNDVDMALSIVEDLSYLRIMRFELMEMKKFPKFSEQIGRFLARTAFYTSDIALHPFKKKELVMKFMNPELCKITEDLVFTDPYFDAKANIINPALRPYLEDVFWKKADLRLEATKLKEIFMNKSQSMLHGDLHTGSIFIDQNELRVFDSEFSYYGPSGFDNGAVIANLLLNYASWTGRDDVTEEQKAEYRNYLLDSIRDLYYHFERVFTDCWKSDAREEYSSVKGYLEYTLKTIFSESMGFAGCKMNRRVIGLAHVADLDSIADEEKRAKAQIYALKIGEALIMNRNCLKNIEDTIELVKGVSEY